MLIQMTDEVKAYLEKKHKDSVEVFVHRYNLSAEGPIEHVEVTMGAPRNADRNHFEAFRVDDYTVFVEKPLIDEHDLMIKLDHLLGLKHLEVTRKPD